MRQVVETKNIYTFDELDESIKERLIEELDQQYIYWAFNDFSLDVYTYLHDDLGFDREDVRINYDLTYSQGDGLSFKCENFLTDKVLSLIDAKLDKNEKRMWHTMLKQDSIKIYSTGNTYRYSYASKHDIDNYTYSELTEKQEQLLDKVTDICRDIYMEECAKLEKIGYECYNANKDYILEYLRSQEYYEDGEVYYA